VPFMVPGLGGSTGRGRDRPLTSIPRRRRGLISKSSPSIELRSSTEWPGSMHPSSTLCRTARREKEHQIFATASRKPCREPTQPCPTALQCAVDWRPRAQAQTIRGANKPSLRLELSHVYRYLHLVHANVIQNWQTVLASLAVVMK